MLTGTVPFGKPGAGDFATVLHDVSLHTNFSPAAQPS